MALEFRKGSMGFPLAEECGDYSSLQRAAFLTDYAQSVPSNGATYSQDSGAALFEGLYSIKVK